ncbi:unnamed protein product [Wuchereria bancrofti]|uniref:Serine carboxypeptidase n=1 Tax=Wuchereria bancrofti TaxID=6293 RepID=A0A3P7DUJ6_WUCBA|nr:unnamed protein product [Wuchereria bancrofti]
MSNEWFMMRIASDYPKSNRQLWTYQENSNFLEQLAGYYQQFFMNDYVTIDYLTIKGAGHFVPLDRGGPSLQMFANFIEKANYSTILSCDTKQKSILPQYQPIPRITPTRKQRDRVWNLPGLTFEPNFKQYSGYLNANSGHLHYWFVESQRDSSNDPLILWLSGEPSCSSLNSLFSGNGPFRPNSDNMTLSENNYSWNKVANVLYLESSRFTGFSEEILSTNEFDFNNNRTAREVFHALMDFLTVFPEYINRPFFITGHSYASLYILKLSARIINRIQVKYK